MTKRYRTASDGYYLPGPNPGRNAAGGLKVTGLGAATKRTYNTLEQWHTGLNAWGRACEGWGNTNPGYRIAA